MKDSKNEAERKILRKVIRDLEKMIYSYQPSATYTITKWSS